MHPPEPIYPCYLPVLGEFNRMTPHEGPSMSLPDDFVCPESAEGPLLSATFGPCLRPLRDRFRTARRSGAVPVHCPAHQCGYFIGVG